MRILNFVHYFHKAKILFLLMHQIIINYCKVNKIPVFLFRYYWQIKDMGKALFVDNNNNYYYYNEKDLNFPDRGTNYKIEKEKEILAVFTECDML